MDAPTSHGVEVMIGAGHDDADLFTLGSQESANLASKPGRGHLMSTSKHEIERALIKLRLSSMAATLDARVLQTLVVVKTVVAKRLMLK